jgi:LSU ribosomal protein L1P
LSITQILGKKTISGWTQVMIVSLIMFFWSSIMSKKGKNFLVAKEKIEAEKKYFSKEALELILSASRAKFDETVDVAIRLGVNPRHADQMVRGSVALPNGLGNR